jgi:protein TonB
MPDEPKPVEPEKGIDPLKQFGVADGSEAGSAEGMAGGVEGGTVGGTLGGTLGGVIGGTGDSPVLDYDQPPRLLKQTRPVYPQEAFIKKIEGVVTLEIVIGVDGRVGRARVLRSIPQLDAAAIQTVRQWVFSPAIKGGRPVATIAQAPVSFRIY